MLSICFNCCIKSLKKFKKIFKEYQKLNSLLISMIGKYNLKRENQEILLMITDGEKWHYLVAKTLSALLRGINQNMR